MRAARQFLLLLWKGAILMKRHWIITIIELAIPLFMILLFVGLKSQAESMNPANPDANELRPAQVFKAFDPKLSSSSSSGKLLLFTPDNDITRKLTRKVYDILGPDGFVSPPDGVDTEAILRERVVLWQNNNSVSVSGLVFNNLEDGATIPKNLDYKIRLPENDFNTNRKFPGYSFSGPSSGDMDYIGSGFLKWQVVVDQAFIELRSNSNSTLQNVTLMAQKFAFPPFKDQSSLLNFLGFMPMFLVYGFGIMMIVAVKRMVNEKSNRAKEMMRMMGLNDLVYFGGTFCYTYILMVVIVTIATILFKIPIGGPAVINKADGFLVWIIFLLYAANTLLFCMFLTTFFNQPVLVAIFTYIIYTLTYQLPVSLMDPPGQTEKYSQSSAGQKLGVALLPNTAINWASRIMSFYEGVGEGSNWSNINKPAPGDNITLAQVMGMMVASCFLCIFFIWYVDNVWPWQFGIPKHPLYLFMPSYWCPKKPNLKGQEQFEANHTDGSYFEEDPSGMKTGISISSLTKIFGWGKSRKVAVNNVTLNMYHGQITALLGHNGAGKTTTMNVITGLFPPSTGDVEVNGYNIRNNLKQARESFGLCPQHNVLYEDLTVEEHLKFFAGLKGRAFSEMAKDIEPCLELLQLTNKRNEISKTLSGGMKRKLSLGIAMIGDSEVLILDEPTAGMDPQARRAIWDLLQQIRERRTIVLTTHYMEEADILGDRIAIMAEGTIQCCGSPLFLKRKFGAGYHLRITKGENFKEHKMTSAIQRSIPSATVETDMKTDLCYILPVTDSEPFVSMFETLEKEKQELGFTACGLTITTMEDVFIKVGQLAEKSSENEEEPETNGDLQRIIGSPGSFQIKPELRLEGWPLYFQQVRGLLTKRFHDGRRYVMFLIFLILLPLIIIFVMLNVQRSVNSEGKNDDIPLKLDLKSVYGNSIGYYTNNTDGNDQFESDIVYNFLNALKAGGAAPVPTDNLTETFIQETDLQKYRREFLVGGSLVSGSEQGSLNLMAMYSGEAYHVSAMSLNLMDNVLLRTVMKDPSATITVTNSPIKYTAKTKDSGYPDQLTDMLNRLMMDVFLPLAMSFLSASFVLFPIHERTTKSKLIQLMTGINGLTFWLTHFLWDYAMFAVSSCIMLIPFLAMDQIGAYSSHSTGTLLVLLLLYGWSVIPLSYLLSFFCSKPASGFTLVSSINSISGILLTIAITVWQFISPSASAPDALAILFRLLPTFTFTWGAGTLDIASKYNVFCKNTDKGVIEKICNSNDSTSPFSQFYKCCDESVCGEACFKERPFYSMAANSCGLDMLFLFLTGCVFFAVLALLESNYIRFWYRFKESRKTVQPLVRLESYNQSNEDSDVAAERSRVEHLYEQGRSSEEALVANNLTKYFSNINAVDHITFSVHQNECFGLLGVNGAGKTTTFSMLTGDLAIDEGTALIQNYDVKNQLKQLQRQVGYCPQFDALLDRLTGKEALYLFARLRGVPEDVIQKVVPELIHMVDLQAHANKTADKYSGGNRRKLSLALALVGSPPVVFLDEPTAGVDPASRRKIWNAFIQAQQAGGTSFILTTHSMEESEALCGRLVIMVNGTFRCLGPIQHLKSKFGQGYTIIVKLNKEQHLDLQATEAVKQFFQDTFPGSLLKDVHQGMLHYHIVDTSVTWSHLFREMEKAKKHFTLEDYLISDTTLEQIFLAFARTQRFVAAP